MSANTLLEIQRSLGRIEGRVSGIETRLTAIESKMIERQSPKIPLRFWIGMGTLLAAAIGTLLGFNI